MIISIKIRGKQVEAEVSFLMPLICSDVELLLQCYWTGRVTKYNISDLCFEAEYSPLRWETQKVHCLIALAKMIVLHDRTCFNKQPLNSNFYIIDGHFSHKLILFLAWMAATNVPCSALKINQLLSLI